MPIQGQGSSASRPDAITLQDWRDAFVDRVSLFGFGLIAVTETLSAFHAVTRVSVAIAWVAAIGGWIGSRRGRPAGISRRKIREAIKPLGGQLQLAFIAIVFAITLVLAVSVPPRHIDAAAYHVPRVYQWIQNQTLEPYPSHIERQIWIGPGAEYFALHLRILAASDRVLNLVQWLSLVAILPVVSLIAREVGGAVRAQRFAVLFAVTLPMAIVQSSGAHVDLFASFWLCVSVAALLRIRREGVAATSARDALVLGAATGIAIVAKAINALFIIPFAAWCLVSVMRRRRVARLAWLAPLALFVAALVNAPTAERNYTIWENPLGNPDKHRVSNETISPASVTSNLIRNASVHLNWYGENRWNRFLESSIVRAHDVLGISADDRRTTYNVYHFRIVARSEDEGSAGNPIHLLLIVAATVIAWSRRKNEAAWFLACVFIGAIIFSAYLKWQPWGSRFHLPLFMVAAGAVAVVLDGARTRIRSSLSVLLAAGSVAPLMVHADHQMIWSHSIFRTPYEKRFYKNESLYPAYDRGAQLVGDTGCRSIGLMEQESSFELPLWRALRNSVGSFELHHVGVTNATRNAKSGEPRVCAIFALYYFDPQIMPPPPLGFRVAMKEERVALYLPAN